MNTILEFDSNEDAIKFFNKSTAAKLQPRHSKSNSKVRKFRVKVCDVIVSKGSKNKQAWK